MDLESQDDLQHWSEMAQSLIHLKDLIEYGQQFSVKMSRYMSPDDRAAVAEMNVKYDFYYWKYFEKFIRKVRGI